MKTQVYLDNAATSYPKPEEVYEAVGHFMREIGVSSGRGAYRKALRADRIIYEARKSLAELFNIKDSKQIVFASNATEALNLAIKGILSQDDHVITSQMEHNAVWRPLKRLEREHGIEITQIPCLPDGSLENPDLVKAAIRSNTSLAVFTHASNVSGTIMPIAEIGEICSEVGVPLLVDSAQTAGAFTVDVEAMKIDLLAFTGHKGLLGPQGTGGLYIREGIHLEPLKEGGTGGDSILETQPDVLPDRYEAGTLNAAGLAGLRAGVQFILSQGIQNIRKRELEFTAYLLDRLGEIDAIKIYGPQDPQKQVGVVSINIADYQPEEVGYVLDEVYGTMVRTGLHCAPCAHRTIGTIDRGTLRISLGYFNTEAEIDHTIKALKQIARRGVG
ncbi:aminotransferase class V-fold PLP-dependent enzyme [Candidatus Poribacteria bacterium]